MRLDSGLPLDFPGVKRGNDNLIIIQSIEKCIEWP
jgi:hypothetical protein